MLPHASSSAAGSNTTEEQTETKPPLAPKGRSRRLSSTLRKTRASAGSDATLTEYASDASDVSEPSKLPDMSLKHPQTHYYAIRRKSEIEKQSVVNHGIRRFNLNPKKGLLYLEEHGVIINKPRDPQGNATRVAVFLRRTRGLNKEQIGEVLGDEDCVLVLEEYMNLFDFSHFKPSISGVECALRAVLAYFKPPGESQKIDRILDKFCRKFVNDTLMIQNLELEQKHQEEIAKEQQTQTQTNTSTNDKNSPTSNNMSSPVASESTESVFNTLLTPIRGNKTLSSTRSAATADKNGYKTSPRFRTHKSDSKKQGGGVDDKIKDRVGVNDSLRRNKNEFHPDTTILIAYLIIMLNVDLHNPNNPRKMNKKQFVDRCRGLDKGKDLCSTEVSSLYDSILNNEIKHTADRDDLSGNLYTNPDKCGWLLKKGSTKLSRWRRRWFLLSENSLYYFKHSEDVEPLGWIPLENVEIVSEAVRNDMNTNDLQTQQEARRERQAISRRRFFRFWKSNSLQPKGTQQSERRSLFRLNTSPSVNRMSSRVRAKLRRMTFSFDICTVDPNRKGVKSVRMARNKTIVLGDHEFIRLRAHSRQEAESWIRVLNQKNILTSQVINATNVTR